MERPCHRGGGEDMQIIFLPGVWMLLLCFLLWPIFQLSAVFLCLNLPDRFFLPDGFFFRSHPFEKGGRIYDVLFRVSRWKHLLPDGGSLWKKRGYKKKHLESCSEANLNRFLIESARGEMSHWLAIFPFWVFGLFTPPIVPWMMLAYALAVNLPCIIAQRYNRPRVKNLLNRIESKHGNFAHEEQGEY